MTSNTVFVFGRTPDLAFAELCHVFPQKSPLRIHTHAAIIEGSIENLSQLIDRLGGTIAIAESISMIDECSPSTIASYIIKEHPESITFSVSTLGKAPVSSSFLSEIKKELSEHDIASRFIVNKKPEPLSAIIVKGQHVTEYLSIPTDEGNLLVKTVEVQNVPEWVKRDFDRPYADPKRGMLPPKVARMVVNIAASNNKPEETSILFDPFCGMGTILAEGMLSGWNVVGSDIAPEVIDHAFSNLGWIQKQYLGVASTFKLFQSDAVHVSQKLEPNSVNAIVTEPFLGSPSFAIETTVDMEEVKNTVKGLEKLYIGALKDWHKVLKPMGLVLMAFPTFRVKEREFFVKKVIDSCEILGYSISEGPWEYGRPNALVSRNFYLLQKK